MSDSVEDKVRDLEYRVKTLECVVDKQGKLIMNMSDKLTQILSVLTRVQYVGYGMAIYFVLSNFGFISALKLAMSL